MKNIIWKKPDGSIAVTTFSPEALEQANYAKSNEVFIEDLDANAVAADALALEEKEARATIEDIKKTPLPRNDEELKAQIAARIEQLDGTAKEKQDAAKAKAVAVSIGRFAAGIKESVGLSAEEHGAILKSRAAIPSDWELAGVDVDIPSDRSTRNLWRWDGRAVKEK